MVYSLSLDIELSCLMLTFQWMSHRQPAIRNLFCPNTIIDHSHSTLIPGAPHWISFACLMAEV